MEEAVRLSRCFRRFLETREGERDQAAVSQAPDSQAFGAHEKN